MKKILPYIAIISIGAFAGNMINIGLSYGIHWLSLDPIAFMESFAVDFPLLLGPTTVTLMPAFIASLWLVFLNKEDKTSRRFWVMAFTALMFINIQTVAYHLPINLKFITMEYTPSIASGKLMGWIILHWVRVVISILAGICAIKAFKISNNN